MLPVPSDNGCCSFFLEWGLHIVKPSNSIVFPSLLCSPDEINLAASQLDKHICSQLLGIFNWQRVGVEGKYRCVSASTGTEANLGAMTQALQNGGKKGLYGLWSYCGSGQGLMRDFSTQGIDSKQWERVDDEVQASAIPLPYVLAIRSNGFPSAPSGIELGSPPPAVEADTCAVEQRCLDFLLTKIGTGKYGALMVELVLANAGLALSPQFVQQLAALTALYEVKLIVDECMSGFQCGFPSLALEYGIELFAISFGKLHGAFALIRQETESVFQYDSEWTSIGGKLRERVPILMIHYLFRLSLFQQQVSSLYNICTKGQLEGLTPRFQERIQQSIVAGNK